MHYYQVGKSKKKVIVVLHGWGLEGSKYTELAKALSEKYRVVVPDLPGFGESKEPPKAYAVDDYVRRVKKFLKDLNITEAHFIGHSFGGRILMKLANKHPQLVKTVVLTGAPGVEKFMPKRTLKRTVYWVGAKTLKIFGFLPPLKKFKTRFYASRDFGKVQGVMKKTFLKVIKENLTKEAKKIQQPVLLLWGKKDQMAPVEDAQKMLKVIPSAYLKIFTKEGHRLPYAKAHEFARDVLQFLAQHQ